MHIVNSKKTIFLINGKKENQPLKLIRNLFNLVETVEKNQLINRLIENC